MHAAKTTVWDVQLRKMVGVLYQLSCDIKEV